MGAIKTERFLQISIGLLLVLLAAVIADGFREKVVNVGDKAPDFRVVTDNGRTLTPSDFGGKLLVLNFWATWCPPCVQEIPSLDEFQKQLSRSGVVVLAVSVDKSEQEYRAFLAKTKVSFLTARDPAAEISGDYGTFRYPETYVIDAKGRVVQKHIGSEVWTNENLMQTVRALL